MGEIIRKKPELLAPAGDMEKLRMAVLYGADAVYLAGTTFGMRAFTGNFTPEELPKAVKFAHDHGVKVHVTVNTMPRNGDADNLPAHLERLNDAGVDALIMADMGVFAAAGKYAPRCQRHISTQASIANYACATAWHELGADRVILARELSLREIREIRERTPKTLEIEAFVHGAMCVSYSGRCLLSNYMTGRDSNRGACAQPCRYQYALMEELRAVSHRDYTTGFLFGPSQEMQNPADGGYIRNTDVVAVAGDRPGWVIQKNKFLLGETLKVLAPEWNPMRSPWRQ